MALTRSFLKGMGLTEEQVSAVIEAHTDTTDALKAQRDACKADADKLAEVQAQLDELRKSGGSWQKKYEEEHSAFEAFRTETGRKAAAAAARSAYAALLRNAGIADRYIDSVLKVSDLTGVKVTEDGKIEGADELMKSIRADFADFIPRTETHGADVSAPPAHGQTYTPADIRGMTAAEINANWPAVQRAITSD